MDLTGFKKLGVLRSSKKTTEIDVTPPLL